MPFATVAIRSRHVGGGTGGGAGVGTEGAGFFARTGLL
jgi:hypothetical protein